MTQHRRNQRNPAASSSRDRADDVRSVLEAAFTRRQSRLLCRVLVAADRPLPVSAIVDHLFVGIDEPVPPAALPAARCHYRDRLCERVLPPLLDAELLAYNRIADTVMLTALGEQQLEESC